MTTALQSYMDAKGLRDADLAAPLGLDRSMVSKIRRGIIRPSLETAAAIERHTEGAVPMQSWVEAPEGAAA